MINQGCFIVPERCYKQAGLGKAWRDQYAFMVFAAVYL